MLETSLLIKKEILFFFSYLYFFVYPKARVKENKKKKTKKKHSDSPSCQQLLLTLKSVLVDEMAVCFALDTAGFPI